MFADFDVGVVLIPDLLDGIGAKFGVSADEGQAVIDGLGNKDAVKCIAVMQGEAMVDFEVTEGDGQLGEVLGDQFELKLIEGDGECEFADVGFDGDFPEGDDAYEDCGAGLNADSGAVGQLRIIF